MGFMAIMKIIFTYLPELISIVKWIKTKTEEGISESQMKKDMKQITEAFHPDKTAQQTAGELNDIFKN